MTIYFECKLAYCEVKCLSISRLAVCDTGVDVGQSATFFQHKHQHPRSFIDYLIFVCTWTIFCHYFYYFPCPMFFHLALP